MANPLDIPKANPLNVGTATGTRADPVGGIVSANLGRATGNPTINATPLGIGVNTILGLPGAALDVAKNVGQSIARSAGSAGLTVAKPIEKAFNLPQTESLQTSDIKSPWGQKLFSTFFGNEPIQPIEDRIAQAELSIKQNPTAQKLGLDKAALPLAFGGIFGETALDLTPFGGLERNIAKKLLEETTAQSTIKILRSANVPEDIAREFAPHFANANTPKAVQETYDTMRGVLGVKNMKTADEVYHAAADSSIEIPVSKIQVGEDTIQAVKDVKQGITTKSNLPILVQKNADGLYEVLDGNHRLADMVSKGKIHVPVITDEKLYRELSAKEESFLGKLKTHPMGTYKVVTEHARNAGTTGVRSYIRKVVTQGKRGFAMNPFAKLAEAGKGGEKPQLPKGAPSTEQNLASPDATTRYAKMAEDAYAAKRNTPENLKAELNANEDALMNSPARGLTKYYGGQDPRFTNLDTVFNKNIGEAKSGKLDVIVQEMGFNDVQAAHDAVLQDLKLKDRITSLKAQLGQSQREALLTKLAGGSTDALHIRQVAKMPAGAEGALSEADAALLRLDPSLRKEVSSLIDIVAHTTTEVKKKINVLDYLRTPDRVLQKIGFAKEAKQLRQGYEAYLKELPKNIDKVSEWAKQVPKESAKTIFQYLDGQAVTLSDKEMKVAGEIKTWLKEWATRLKLPEDKTITNYITHIFDAELIKKEFDEDLAKIITDKIPGSVYDPFLLKRLGAKGYKQDVWQALDAYVKRGTRKVNMDDALKAIQDKAGTSLEMANIEASQFKYIQRYISGVNMRPTELDNLLDNTIKTFVGYKYGQRPVTYLTKTLRQMTYRGLLGLNPGSALRNLSQGINTYAVLGEKYTAVGYLKLFSRGATNELRAEGVLAQDFIQDRKLSSTRRAMEKVDKGLFSLFEAAERINRGAAYFGAKSKALKQGKTIEEAVDYAKEIVRKTQFSFGSVDTPVALQSDIVKTIAQFQNYTLKQTEFLAEMVKDKNFVGLLRYGVAGIAFLYSIGQLFGMRAQDLIPTFRFDTPPSLKLPVETAKALLNTPDKYNQPRSLGQKAKDIGNAALGLIPGGSQLKKSIEGVGAYSAGKDVTATGKTRFTIPHTPGNAARSILFGKNSLPQAKAYYNKSSTKKNPASTNPLNI